MYLSHWGQPAWPLQLPSRLRVHPNPSPDGITACAWIPLPEPRPPTSRPLRGRQSARRQSHAGATVLPAPFGSRGSLSGAVHGRLGV